jgi:HK97 family phage major capsid protein
MAVDTLLKELIEKRAQAWESAKHFWDSEESTREAADAEAAQKASDEITAMDERIDELWSLHQGNTRSEQRRDELDKIVRPDTRDEEEGGADLLNFLRGGPGNADFGKRFEFDMNRSVAIDPQSKTWSLRALTSNVAASGGDTVPTSFVNTLYEHMVANSAIRQTNVRVVTTSSGESLEFPKTVSHGTATLVGEGTAIAGSDPSFGKVTLQAWRYGQLVIVPNELLQDTGVDLLGYLARDMGRAVGAASGAAFITGDGALKPNGVVVATKAQVGTSIQIASATVEAQNLIDLQYAVIEPYATNGWWMMSRATAGKVRGMKDAAGSFVWGAGLVPGAPNTILGNPYVTDPSMAAVASAAMSVLFGDFSAYVIRDVSGIGLERSDDYAFNTYSTAFRVVLRTDGDLLDGTGAIKGLDTD